MTEERTSDSLQNAPNFTIISAAVPKIKSAAAIRKIANRWAKAKAEKTNPLFIINANNHLLASQIASQVTGSSACFFSLLTSIDLNRPTRRTIQTHLVNAKVVYDRDMSLAYPASHAVSDFESWCKDSKRRRLVVHSLPTPPPSCSLVSQAECFSLILASTVFRAFRIELRSFFLEKFFDKKKRSTNRAFIVVNDC